MKAQIGIILAVLLSLFIQVVLYAESPPPEFQALARYDANNGVIVLSVTAEADDMCVFQIGIPRPWADDVGVRSSTGFTIYPVPYDEAEGADDRERVDHANKIVLLLRGRVCVSAHKSVQILLPVARKPKVGCRIDVGAMLPGPDVHGSSYRPAWLEMGRRRSAYRISARATELRNVTDIEPNHRPNA